MYRNLALASGAITALLFLAWCALGLAEQADPQNPFWKDYGYTLGLLTLPFCCGLAPLTGVMTIVFTVLAMNESRATRIMPPPGPPNQSSGL